MSVTVEWLVRASGRASQSGAGGTANGRGRNTLGRTSPRCVARAVRRDLRRLASGNGGLANGRTGPTIARRVRGGIRVWARGSGPLGCVSRGTRWDVTRSVRRDLVRGTGGYRVTVGDVARRMGRDLRARISGRDVRRVAMGKVAAWVRWALRGFASGSRGLSSSGTVRAVARAVRVSLRRRA